MARGVGWFRKNISICPRALCLFLAFWVLSEGSLCASTRGTLWVECHLEQTSMHPCPREGGAERDSMGKECVSGRVQLNKREGHRWMELRTRTHTPSLRCKRERTHKRLLRQRNTRKPRQRRKADERTRGKKDTCWTMMDINRTGRRQKAWAFYSAFGSKGKGKGTQPLNCDGVDGIKSPQRKSERVLFTWPGSLNISNMHMACGCVCPKVDGVWRGGWRTACLA